MESGKDERESSLGPKKRKVSWMREYSLFPLGIKKNHKYVVIDTSVLFCSLINIVLSKKKPRNRPNCTIRFKDEGTSSGHRNVFGDSTSRKRK